MRQAAGFSSGKMFNGCHDPLTAAAARGAAHSFGSTAQRAACLFIYFFKIWPHFKSSCFVTSQLGARFAFPSPPPPPPIFNWWLGGSDLAKSPASCFPAENSR